MKKFFPKDIFLWTVVACSIVVKLLLFLWVSSKNHPLGFSLANFPDSFNYIFPAQTFIEKGIMLEPHFSGALTFRTPGYPLFLSMCMFLFGKFWMSGVIGVQLLVSSSLILFVYKTCRIFGSRMIARLASVLCAISTVYLAYSFAFLSDVLFSLFMLLFVYAACLFIKTKNKKTLFVSSLFLLISIYIRPVAYNLVWISFGLFCLFSLLNKNYKNILSCLLFFLFPILLGMSLWTLRNKSLASYNQFHSGTAYNLYFWNLDAVAEEKGLTPLQGSDLLRKVWPEGMENWSIKDRDEWLLEKARPMMKKYFGYKLMHAPFWLTKTLLGGSFTHLSRVFWGNPPLDANEFAYELNKKAVLPQKHLGRIHTKILFILCLFQTVLTAVCAVAGGVILLLRKRNRNIGIFLTLYVCYLWAISSMFFGAGGRYRAPFESILCVLGGIGLHWIIIFFKKRIYNPNVKLSIKKAGK